MAEQRRGQVQDRRLQELTDLGLDPAAAQAWLASQDPEGQGAAAQRHPLVIWPENWPTLGVFLRLQTQWRQQPETGAPMGLRYDQADVVLRRSKVADPDRVFDHLIEMEHAVLKDWHGSD